MRPRIAIPRPHSQDPEHVAKAFPQYCQAVEAAGGEPVEISLQLANQRIARLAASCDGILLPGSRSDISPERYGAARHPRTAPDDPPRWNVDELLLQDAYNMHKPLLGVCFGLQSLNVWRSGTLTQHLEGPVQHSGTAQESAPLHSVAIAPDSRLATILGMDSDRRSPAVLTVNSSHHQAAAKVGDGLRAVAWCPGDRVIEALEGIASSHWVVAVQWHPERMTEDAAARALFRAFVSAARERRGHPRNATVDFESIRSGWGEE
jgi:putative glutamine amidotransferase